MSNMSAPFGFGFSARYMMDQTMKFYGEGLPVFLRMQLVDESLSDFADIGLQVSVSGSVSGGYQDYQIVPQPIVEMVPTRRGDVPEVQMQIDDIKFTISHSWVLSQQATLGLSSPMQVFRDRRVVGLVFDNEVCSIESIIDQQAGGQIIYWEVTTSRAENNQG